MTGEHLVTTNEDLAVDAHTATLFPEACQDHHVRPLAQGRVVTHELVTDADDGPLGVECAGSSYWEVGEVVH